MKKKNDRSSERTKVHSNCRALNINISNSNAFFTHLLMHLNKDYYCIRIL